MGKITILIDDYSMPGCISSILRVVDIKSRFDRGLFRGDHHNFIIGIIVRRPDARGITHDKRRARPVIPAIVYPPSKILAGTL